MISPSHSPLIASIGPEWLRYARSFQATGSSRSPALTPLLYQANRGHPKAWLFPLRAFRPVRTRPWLRLRCILQTRIQQMVLPDAIDAQIFARITFAPEAGVFQQPHRAGIARDAGRFEPV